MLILAPLRGVTIRAFRQAFAGPIAEAGFSEAITPFISANAGVDPLKDRELKNVKPAADSGLRLTPQFIGKDPKALRECLKRIREAGYATADLNCGCPYPMVRNKGRGSGLLRTPEILLRMTEVGCEVMGEGNFSLKARLGVDKPGELLSLMPRLNQFPLRFLTVHARTARQMYDGDCNWAAYREIESVARMPLIPNGDIPLPASGTPHAMIGRSFIRALGLRPDIGTLLKVYTELSQAELYGDHAVLGRLKELTAYWKDLAPWHRRWPVLKIARTLDEFISVLPAE